MILVPQDSLLIHGETNQESLIFSSASCSLMQLTDVCICSQFLNSHYGKVITIKSTELNLPLLEARGETLCAKLNYR